MTDLCPFAVARDSIEDEYQAETVSESNLVLLKQQKYCDVTFKFPNLPDRIQAHEFCLKARSPVFAKIFGMRKSGNVEGSEIEIRESTPQIFQRFLEFIYADKLEVGIAGALDLLQLAQKYKVQPLTKKCEELLKTKISVVNCVKVFEAARRYGLGELMDRAGQIMVKSFLNLARTGALGNAEEETLVYLLENDNLAVQEVELFQTILNWGINKVGSPADQELLKNKLKNLIYKIRYTNMAPDQFTKVVLPTGLLSAEDTVSVYSYFCADEATRKGLNIKFNTTCRVPKNMETVTKSLETETKNMETATRNMVTATKNVVLHVNRHFIDVWCPAFSKHCTSFKVDRTQAVGKVGPESLPKKTVMTQIQFVWPQVHSQYKERIVLNFNVSIVEHSGPVQAGNFTTRFRKILLNCKQKSIESVSMETPVELVCGRTYSVIVEDYSNSESITYFRKAYNVYQSAWFPKVNQESKVYFGDVSLTLKDIHKKIAFYAHKVPDWSQNMALIESIKIGLM